LGCEIVKIFPGGQVGGPAFVKAILAPSPWSSLMPTGGVDCTEESLCAWFQAGVACVGMGANLISRDLQQARDYQGMAKRVRKTLEMIRAVKGAS
jgi:2-dehydro-3-deoxyphosphogluconate aldolase / (4S)-4-hydroxy-2-oxoglutarate aldolase